MTIQHLGYINSNRIFVISSCLDIDVISSLLKTEDFGIITLK